MLRSIHNLRYLILLSSQGDLDMKKEIKLVIENNSSLPDDKQNIFIEWNSTYIHTCIYQHRNITILFKTIATYVCTYVNFK